MGGPVDVDLEQYSNASGEAPLDVAKEKALEDAQEILQTQKEIRQEMESPPAAEAAAEDKATAAPKEG